ncbi:MAG: LLM class flavin-dependent oxidoreductase [Nitrososphaerales archaeon]
MGELKFGIEISITAESLRRISVKAEELGYNFIFYGDSLSYNSLECWTAISAMSSFTRSIRVGPSMTFLSYRHPAVLARASATVDRLSSGRLELRIGIGGRSLKRDSTTYGVPFPPYLQRVRRLDEGLTLIKKLWTLEKSSQRGRYFSSSNAAQKIKPIQRPHPPITIAGTSEKVVDLAIKHANVWEVGGVVPAEYRKLHQTLTSKCKKGGRDVNSIERSLEVTIALFTRGGDAIDGLRRKLRNKFDKLAKRWTLIAGRPDHIISELNEFVDLGIERFSIHFLNYNGINLFFQRPSLLIDQMEIFREQVIPHLKH